MIAHNADSDKDPDCRLDLEPNEIREFPQMNVFKFCTFTWVSNLVFTGYRQQLEHEDLWVLRAEDEASELRKTFWELLECKELKQKSKEKPELQTHSKFYLLWTFMRVVKRDIMLSGLFMFFYTVVQIVQPLFLRELVNSLSETNAYTGLYYSIGLFFFGLLGAFSSQLMAHYNLAAGRKSRSLFMTLVYQHALELNVADMGQTSQGVLYNMISADAQKLFDVSQFMHLVWAGPLQIIIVTVFLLLILGWPALAGIGMLALIAPVNFYMAKAKRNLRAKHMPVMDARVRLCTEILAGIQAVKQFAWERPFMERIREIREKQMRYVFLELYLFALVITVLIVTPLVSTWATFLVYSLGAGFVLSAGDVFASLAFFNVLKFPLMQVSQLLMNLAQVLVAMERLQAFLSIGSIDPNTQRSDKTNDLAKYSKTALVEMNNASFAWRTLDKGDDHEKDGKDILSKSFEAVESPDEKNVIFSLKDLTFSVNAGELIAVVGPVGQGKTSLVNAILGEMNQLTGEVKKYKGRIGYCSQTPWIINATVEENITFGRPFDQERFKKVLTAAQLWDDLDQFAEGEKTVIGERGITLSGGQKARVSLARAAYSDSRLLLLDDPLSALDSHVGRKVFNELLGPEGFLKSEGRAIVLVTHAIQYLGIVDKVFVLFQGRLAYQGKFNQLEAMHKSTEVENKNKMTDSGKEDITLEIDDHDSLNKVMEAILIATQHEEEVNEDGNEPKDEKRKKKLLNRNFKSSRLMTIEERKEGKLDITNIIPPYIKATGGYAWMTFVFSFIVLERVIYISADFWLAWWTEAENGPPKPDSDGLLGLLPAGNTKSGIIFYNIGYTIFLVLTIIFVIARCFTFVYGGATGAKSIFDKMAWTVLRSPMEFFDTTPLGRITNRFSFDTEIVDDMLIQNLQGLSATIFWLTTSILVIAIVTTTALIIVVPVLMVFFAMYQLYRKSCVELQRLDSTSRSPVQTHFRESLDGLSTIRAFCQTDRFIFDNTALINQNHAAMFAFVSSNRWFGFRLEIMGAFVTLSVALSGWLLRKSIEPGLLGLAVLWAFNLTVALNYFMNLGTQAEAKMTSLERMLYYTNNLDQEPALDTDLANSPPSNWPAKGGVVFSNVTMRYRKGLPLVLKGISFDIQPGENVGICGRTGSGKSTISQVLFRLRAISSGTISVDGIDLHSLGLADVRGRACTIISQDPLIFSGTVRFNLDPFGLYTDKDIEGALDKARLGKRVTNMGGIDARVEESGSNFSQGERQLLCLARVILRSPKVVFCDEMCSSVDSVTDEMVHEAIKTELKASTVIEVAHRLSSIVGYSRVMVLDTGKIAEFDAPHKLMQNPNGAFRKLVESYGPSVTENLISMMNKEE